MAQSQYEAPLTNDEIIAILKECAPEGLLVGGQALAFWALHFDVELPEVLQQHVTADIDFVAHGELATRLGKRLKGWSVYLPTLDDATSQTGKVALALADGGVKQVDFLSGVVGLDTAAIRSRAAKAAWPGARGLTVQVMHPLDVLMSRVKNLELLPSKRNPTGIGQARLAVGVARAFLLNLAKGDDDRKVLNGVERVIDIALDPAGIKIFVQYQIDPLEAIQADLVKAPKFKTERWPRVVEQADRLRKSLEAQQARSVSRPTSPGGGRRGRR